MPFIAHELIILIHLTNLRFRYDVPYVYTIEYVENNLKIPNTKSTQILSVIGEIVLYTTEAHVNYG